MKPVRKCYSVDLQNTDPMIESIKEIDVELFQFLNPLGHPYLDGIMWYISAPTTWIPLYLLFVWWIWEQKGWRTLIVVLLSAAVVVTLSDQISVNLFKEVFQRYRPTHNHVIGEHVLTVFEPNGNEYRGGKFGFVSSHATNHFAIAFFLFLVLRPMWWVWGILLFLWATVISYSRIYLGVHFPADVTAGALLGISIGGFVYLLYSLILPKLKLK